MKLNPCKIIPRYYNKFTLHMHTSIIYALIFNTLNIAIPFIKTPYSWLFHITRICISEYIMKISKNNITIHFIIFWYYRKFTQWYKHIIHYRSICLSILLKTWIKITTKSHVLLKKFPKQQLKSKVYPK